MSSIVVAPTYIPTNRVGGFKYGLSINRLKKNSVENYNIVLRIFTFIIDGSPLGSSVPGILQARTLEWVAISSSNA